MKSIIVTAILLTLAIPAYASPRSPTPAQERDIAAMQTAFSRCGGYDGPAEDRPELTEACALSDKLITKLGKQGFCFYGHLAVGRASRDGQHCYKIPN